MGNLSKTFGKLTIPLLLLLVIFFFTLPVQAKYGGGTGEPNDPYLIFDANQMNAIGADSNDWDKCFLLCADIDLRGFTGTSFNIIGTGFFQSGWIGPIFVSTPFRGSFDGNSHKISNFTYISTETDSVDCIGMFGVVDGVNAEIKNLGLIDDTIDVGLGVRIGSLVGYLVNGNVTNCYVKGGSISGDKAIGGLVGWNRYGTISNCYSESRVSGDMYVGGLVAYHDRGGTITNCYSTGSVSGNWRVGGLVGRNYHGTIINCYSTASVSSDGGAGGLVGSNSGPITNCYSEGDVSGNRYVGGLVGTNGVGTITNSYAKGDVEGGESIGGLAGFNDRTVVNCYSTGNVSGTTNVGGLVGETDLRSKISHCYAASYVTGATNVGGLIGYDNSGSYTKCFWDNTVNPLLTGIGNVTDPDVIGESTANMQTKSTFIEAGWDFVGEYENGPNDDWAEPNGGGYPILWWQLSPLPELPTFSGGTGTADDPYLLSTAEDLNRIGHNPRLMKAHYKLIDNIDLAGIEFFIVGNSIYPFTGVFDGNGKTISNFSYSSTDKYDIGFFGVVNDAHSEIADLNLRISFIKAERADKVGTLVGRLEAGTINGCNVERSNVSGMRYVGGVVGFNRNGTILNCTSSGNVSGGTSVGGLVGSNHGVIRDCVSHSSIISGGGTAVGGLVGRHMHISRSDFEIRDCYATGSVLGDRWVAGLVGENMGPISKCGSSSRVLGNSEVGGLVGFNTSRIRSCYSTGSISGTTYVGGLAGRNRYQIYDCYSRSSVLGNSRVGGLVGWNDNNISNCYSVGGIAGTTDVGGLVGLNDGGTVSNSFWNIQTSGQTTSDGGTGLTTAEMQTESTFTDAGWDFTTPIWTIVECLDYPRLRWETPVLHAEPEVTLGTSNTISWDPVVGATEYYAECAADANFTSIIHNSGWITEISYEFTGLEVGKRYWYSLKARNTDDTETNWSNVESSLQCTLADAVEIELTAESLKNDNLKTALLNKINAVQQMIDEGLYEAALNKLQNDILQKTNGCAETGEPDKNDWIITCEGQNQIYTLIIETIEYVKGVMQ